MCDTQKRLMLRQDIANWYLVECFCRRRRRRIEKDSHHVNRIGINHYGVLNISCVIKLDEGVALSIETIEIYRRKRSETSIPRSRDGVEEPLVEVAAVMSAHVGNRGK